jgi:hypothetical protein
MPSYKYTQKYHRLSFKLFQRCKIIIFIECHAILTILTISTLQTNYIYCVPCNPDNNVVKGWEVARCPLTKWLCLVSIVASKTEEIKATTNHGINHITSCKASLNTQMMKSKLFTNIEWETSESICKSNFAVLIKANRFCFGVQTYRIFCL